jgi:hypothetical protein
MMRIIKRKGSSDHFEHLVLSYLEAISVGGSRHRSVGLLLVFQLFVCGVVRRNVSGSRFVVYVALIAHEHVISCSK